MIGVTFEVRGLDGLVKRYGAGAGPILQAVTRGIAEEIREKIAKYPGPVKRPVEWKSAAQRAWYIAARRGMGPYKRQSDSWSQRLGPSWATSQRGLGAVVGTRVSYAPYVQSAEQQQPMHRNTGWVTDKQVVDEVQASGAAEKILKEVLRDW